MPGVDLYSCGLILTRAILILAASPPYQHAWLHALRLYILICSQKSGLPWPPIKSVPPTAPYWEWKYIESGRDRGRRRVEMERQTRNVRKRLLLKISQNILKYPKIKPLKDHTSVVNCVLAHLLQITCNKQKHMVNTLLQEMWVFFLPFHVATGFHSFLYDM